MRTLVLFAASLPALAQSYENLDATLWAQTAVEFRASTRQTFAAARHSLDRALKDRKWTAATEQTSDYRQKPPAIILDADETVLDNTAYRARLLLAGGKKFDDASWNAWVAEAKATALAGAAEFLRYAESRNVAIFYVTNRPCRDAEGDATRANVISAGLPYRQGRLLCRTTTSDKSPRRAQIAEKHRVLLLLGDDFNDFVTAPATLAERDAKFAQHAAQFGERWFILPNPMYGSWERSFADDVKKKLAGLRP
jgi:5'-nucleotidase (lipoprotein e(P4) family)